MTGTYHRPKADTTQQLQDLTRPILYLAKCCDSYPLTHATIDNQRVEWQICYKKFSDGRRFRGLSMASGRFAGLDREHTKSTLPRERNLALSKFHALTQTTIAT